MAALAQKATDELVADWFDKGAHHVENDGYYRGRP